MAKWTSNPWRWCWRRGRGLVGWGLVLGALPAAAGESAPPASPSSPMAEATLSYTETAYVVQNVGMALRAQTTPFKHEPASRGQVVRGTLNFGGASNGIAFFWQPDQGQLRLDLNHNQDLTDDPAGVFSRNAQGSLNDQTFTNVHLALRTPAGPCRVVADLQFWNYSSRPGCSVGSHSFWQGRVTLAGEDWQVGIIPNYAQADFCAVSCLLLRPWSRHNDPFNANGNDLDALPFSEKVFFGGHGYQVRCAPAAGGAEFAPTLQLVEQTVPLGDLQVTGQFIRRLVLTGGNYQVICDRPKSTEKVPAGDYFPPKILLDQNGVQAVCDPVSWGARKSVSVSDRTPAILDVGGPLTNSVNATRRGEYLVLSYQLVGAGGQSYTLRKVDRTKPPEFAIYKGQRKIAAGNFEFG